MVPGESLAIANIAQLLVAPPFQKTTCAGPAPDERNRPIRQHGQGEQHDAKDPSQHEKASCPEVRVMRKMRGIKTQAQPKAGKQFVSRRDIPACGKRMAVGPARTKSA
jgi:hypothetical protein